MCNVEESTLKKQIAIKATVFLRELMLNTIVWDLVDDITTFDRLTQDLANPMIKVIETVLEGGDVNKATLIQYASVLLTLYDVHIWHFGFNRIDLGQKLREARLSLSEKNALIQEIKENTIRVLGCHMDLDDLLESVLCAHEAIFSEDLTTSQIKH